MISYISDSEIDRIIEEDVAYFDLTSRVIELSDRMSNLAYYPRHRTVAACTEEVARVLEKIGLKVTGLVPSGTEVDEETALVSAQGESSKIHMAWRTGSKILEYYCGLATRTYDFVKSARSVNSSVNIACTRKNIPGTKKMAIKTIVSAGAFPHRIGLSETVLIFDEHIRFLGGVEQFIEKIPEIKARQREKKIGAECHNHADGIKMTGKGIDFIQLDKFSPEELKIFMKEAKEINPGIVVVAAGNINQSNVAEYASAGPDVIASSFMYHGKPADIRAVIEEK